MNGSRWLLMREWENMSKMISKLCPGCSTLIVTNGVVYSTITHHITLAHHKIILIMTQCYYNIIKLFYVMLVYCNMYDKVCC